MDERFGAFLGGTENQFLRLCSVKSREVEIDSVLQLIITCC